MKGGPQPGAGRPKGCKAGHTIQAEKAREYIIKRVTEELEPIINVLIQKAKSGETMAIKELLDRAYGKPKETVEHTGEVQIDIDIKKTIDKVYGNIN